MRLFLGLLLLTSCASPAWSQNEELTDSLRPTLVAISVNDLDETVKWYRDNLGFVVKQKNVFPDYSLRIAFLELNSFEIELVEDKKSVSLSAIRKSLPQVNDRTRIQGFVKLAFTVSNVEALASKLRRNGVTFQARLTESNRTKGQKHFIVKDNNGNWIQFFGNDPPTRTAQTPTRSNSQPSDAQIFAQGIVSTPDDEFNVTFTPDGKSVYFTKSVVRAYLYSVCVSRYEHGQWNAPKVASFSGFYRDFDPFVARDGSKLFFVSDRPFPGVRENNNVDIWVVERKASGWSEPRNLGQPVNSNAAETYPTVTNQGILYFSSDRVGGKGDADIYRSRLVNGRYTSPENLGEAINSQYAETEAYIAADESFIIFISNRPGGFGSFDLYLSYNTNGQWTKPVNLGSPINSEGYDLNPSISPDGKYFFFASDRGFATAPIEKRLNYVEMLGGLRSVQNGFMNIYRVEIGALNLDR